MNDIATPHFARPQWRSLLALATLLVALPVQGQEFRQLNRIATPSAAQKLPPGARPLASPRPVSAERIEGAVKSIAAAWNTQQLGGLLADNFNDKSRLLDSLNAAVPRDATLRLLSIQAAQTLVQYSQTGADGVPATYSRVSVTARTQLEYTDGKGAAQRLDGTNEMILLLREPQS